MKKSLICGVASLLMATTSTFGAFAETPQAGTTDGHFIGSKDVTVGEVDETIYSIDITWGDMAFDWKYNETEKAFHFVGKHVCTEIGIGSTGEGQEPSLDGLYKDNTCTEPATDFIGPFYMNALTSGTIDITDSTINGQIKAKASFTPEDKYSWVTGRFSSVAYMNINNTFSQDLENGYLVGMMGTAGHTDAFNGILYLEGDGIHNTSNSVTAGDKIGTVTINIEPDLN